MVKIKENRYKNRILKPYLLFMITLCFLLSFIPSQAVLAKELDKDVDISFENTSNILKSNKNQKISVKLHNKSSMDKECNILISLYDNKDKCINSVAFKEVIKAKDSTKYTSYMRIIPEACRIKAQVVDSTNDNVKLANTIYLYTSNLGISARREKVVEIKDIKDEINKNDDYTLPESVVAMTNKGKVTKVPVMWDDEVNTSKVGVFTYKGKVPVINKEVKLTLSINSNTSKNDDEVITFPDKNLESAIRLAIDKPSGNIYKGEVKNLKKFVPINYGIMEINDLKGIEHLEALEVLDIDYMGVSDLTPVRDLRNLKWLYSANNPIGNLKANTFRNLKNLEQLGLEGCNIDTIEKGAFDGLTKLHYLDITYNTIFDLEEIANISTLTSLHLDYNRVSNLKPLSRLTNLELLWIDGNGIEDISSLGKLVNLKNLRISNNNIKSLSSLRNLTALEKLQINKNKLTNLEGMENMTSLKELFANENPLTDVKAMKNLKNLDNLQMKNTKTLRDISSFDGLVNLTHLDLTGNKVDNISSLSSLTKLEYAWMEDNAIVDIKPLANLVNLKTLKLKGNKIKDYSPVSGYYHKLKTKDFILN